MHCDHHHIDVTLAEHTGLPTSKRCKFTVSPFIIATSSELAPVGKGGGEDSV